MRTLFVYSIVFAASGFWTLDSLAFSSSPAGSIGGRCRCAVRVSERHHGLSKNNGCRTATSSDFRRLFVVPSSTNSDDISNHSNPSVLDAIKIFGRRLFIVVILSIMCFVGDVGPAHANMWFHHKKSHVNNDNSDSPAKVIVRTKPKSPHLELSIPTVVTNNNRFFSRLKKSNHRDGNSDIPSHKKKHGKLKRKEGPRKPTDNKSRGVPERTSKSMIRWMKHPIQNVQTILADHTKPFMDWMKALTATMRRMWKLFFHDVMNLCLQNRPVRLVTVAALAGGAGAVVGYKIGVSQMDNARNQTTTTTTTTSKEPQQPPPSKDNIPSKVSLIRTDNNNSSLPPTPKPTPTNSKSNSPPTVSTTSSVPDEKKQIHNISLKKMNEEERLEIAIQELKRAKQQRQSINNLGGGSSSSNGRQSVKEIVQTGLQKSRVDRLRDWWNK